MIDIQKLNNCRSRKLLRKQPLIKKENIITLKPMQQSQNKK